MDSGSQLLTLYDNGQPVNSMKVIVGTNELPTPLISSIMYYMTYNPYWHAPDHLVRKTIAPTVLRQGMKYLKSHGYSVVDKWSENPSILDAAAVDWKGASTGSVHLLVRQDPGPLNSMGNLKFPFPNPEGIYLHDTPNKSLFASERAQPQQRLRAGRGCQSSWPLAAWAGAGRAEQGSELGFSWPPERRLC